MYQRVLQAAAFVVVFLTSIYGFAAAPTATTTAASSITTSSAVLNGTGVPAGEQTTGWFRISATNPGACNDTFGTRVPAAGGTDLGSGVTSVPYGITSTGLTSGVTYYFCAIVQNASGTAFGGVLSFTVPGAPVVTTTGTSSVTSSSATLEGSANPNSGSAVGWFRYSTTDPGTCNDTFGTRAPSSGGTSLGSGTSPVAYTRAIAGLTPGTTYYYCAISDNVYGTSFGAVLTFSSLANAPATTTNSATLITGTTAQLNGSVNPGGAATTGWFRFATTNPGSCNDTFGTRAPTTGGSSLGAGNASVAYGVGVTGLISATTYFYCAIAQNSVGTTFGAIVSFSTPAAPVVTTQAASSLANTSAQLNGFANPNGAPTTGYFRYGLTDPGACNDTFGSRAPATGGTNLGSGTSNVSFNQFISSLSAGTTYYFCAIASNSEGLSFGAVLNFVTPTAPTAVTSAATLVTSSSATLNGAGDPNGNSAFGYYRYATTNPGVCSDSFGTRAPPSSFSDTSLGAGTTNVNYANAISGLTPATTYYFCAIVYNSYGTAFGSVLSFTTLANPPSVSTNGSTLLTGTTAQLNGTANPGGAATTGWFRYATASPGACNDSFGTRAPATGGTALGSGNSGVAYLQGITGLTAGTTYYVCAIAQNSVGTSFGSVVQFTTPLPPVVTSNGASSLTNTFAQLNGQGNPNGSTTTGYFRYSTTDPVTCNDTFGSRAPATGGSNLGAGNSFVSFNQGVSGLSAGTTYYFCAIASSFEGTAFGVVQSFVTPTSPNATTNAATLVTSSTATLNGAGDPNGDSSGAYGYFRYSTTNPGACSDSFGTRIPSSSFSDTFLGTGTNDVPYAIGIGGLAAGTTYFYCAIVRNTYGNGFGAVLSFTTLANAPVVSTNSASLVTSTTAQLNGTANPGGSATTGWFRYSTTSPGTCNDTFGTRAPAAGGTALGSGTSGVAYLQAITGLTAATTYFYCAIAQNGVGLSVGSIVQFTTPTPPSVTTVSATSLTNTSAQLNGSANPNGSTTTGWFRYALTDPGACDDSFGSRAPTTGGSALGSGSSAIGYNVFISGLSPGTTYYYCAIASSFEGTAFGAVLTFVTPTVPTATTSAATLITSTSVTFNGASDPNGDAGFGFFRYATSNPGICNNLFGTRWPTNSFSDASLGSGTNSVPFSFALTGLTPATTYFFCALGRNAYGTAVGSVLSFTTLPNLPSVSTNTPTLLTGTTAQLNGTANPGGAAATGWFRYATASPGTCNDTFGTRAPAAGGTALGSGNSNVAYLQGITGLTAGTTDYYCALASNSAGTSVGAVVSFQTPLPPIAATTGASSIANTSASLDGVAIPNGSTTTGYFRYSLTDPGACDDTFGSRAPATGGSALGTGTSPVNYSQFVTGLSAGTTYYFCAIANSFEGTAFGAVLSFTTPTTPITTTTAATLVTSSSATLNGLADPNGDSAFGYFRYATTNPGACSDSFGTRAPPSSFSDTSLGAGTTDVAFSRSITGLTPGTTYFFCALGRNGYGTTFGSVLSFTTLANAPTVTTNSATLLTGTTAQLNATANPGGAATTGWFRYATASPGACNDTFGTRAPTTGGTSLGSGTTNQNYLQGITGLTAGTTYFYCAIAQNSVATAFGAVVQFTTPLPPVVTTQTVSSLADTSVQLNSAANPNGSTTTGWFRYSLTDPGACNDTFGSRAPATGGSNLGAGNSSVGYNQFVSGLSAGTTYYYCAIASSFEGTAFGSVLSFTTPTVPTTTSTAATLITSNSAQVNGSADPNGDSAFGYFRFSTVNPGVCTDSFGTRAPPSSFSDQSLGAGTVDVPFSRSLTGLTPGTTYYYCAAGRNNYGVTFGAVLSFTTQATLPAVTTNSATAITTTAATLNATANPNGAATTGWFRYSTASPGACNDTFGTRAPTTGGTSLGAGTTSTNYLQTISGLTPGTTYYFCAIVQNSVGTTFGAVVQFNTTAPPSVNTLAATPVTATTATLNGTVNPNGFSTTGLFRYSTTNPGVCDQVFGTATANQALGAGSSFTPIAQPLTGLAPATTYYFCVIATSSIGTTLGAVLSFTTPAAPPSVTTVAATLVTNNSATLNATVNPNGGDSTAWFRYATANPGTCNDTFGTRAPAAGGTALGSGNTPVNVGQPVTGLTNGTTYFFCVLASSSVGTSVGTILSFTTSAAPTVTTSAATAVASTSATLNGSANPNFATATGWFRYDTTNPVTCNDTFGTRAPATGGTALGAGSTPVAFNQPVTGLTPATTYFYCAIASNSVGTGFGTVQTFATAASPTVTTGAASAITGTTATLNGSANPNLLTATGWFRYSTVNPVTCNDTFGTRAPAAGGTALGAGSSAVPYTQNIAGLTAGTTYYVCAIASNSAGTGFGTVQSFTTVGPPVVTTTAATLVANTTATLNGSANPNLGNATGWFRYSTTVQVTCNDTFGTRAPAAGGTALGAGSAAVPYSQAITGLTAGATYYYCAIASNAAGTAFGTVLTFTTLAAPTVTTTAATTISSTGATLNGSANPRLSDSTGWYRYSVTNPVTCNDTFGTRAPTTGGTALGAGNAAVPFTESLTGLTPGTLYYFCAIAQNAIGTSFGTVLSFTTTAAPVATTNAATVVASTTATLNGTGNPRLDTATGWYRYSTTNPVTCDDSFGTRAPATGGTNLGAGNAAVAYTQALTGLTSATTYYFCAIVSNSVGTSFGTVLSFTTAAAPAVTTNAATLVTNNSATLNGSANPNLLTATGWFRYATTNPVTCNDTFGTRAPAAGGTALGAGGAAVAYLQAVTGLVSGTTYFYCAIASNSAGTGFGTVQSFTTAGPPIVTTAAATLVVSTTATLNGSATPNQLTATGWFRYATTNPVTCNDTFGTRAPAAGGTALGAGTTPVAYSQAVTGLTAGATYFYCAIASNSAGTSFGTVQTFTTLAPPTVTSSAATAVTSTDATLNGSANPRLDAATGWFRYSLTNPVTCNDTFGTRTPATGGTSLGAGNTAVPYSEPITGLVPGGTYYFCAIASNSVGTAFGAVLSFTTTAAPITVTVAATTVGASSATLNGSANPKLDAATGWFRYATTDPGVCNDTFGTRAPTTGGTNLGAGNTSVAYSQTLTGLASATTYFFCAIASNSSGTSFGAVLSFTTTAAPTVITTAATAVTGTGATLNGSANPNLAVSTGWYRYSATDPGTCNDTFGTRAPAAGGTSLGGGGSAVPYTQAITGLTAGVTYYFCAIASNAAGTGLGTVLSFTTPAAPTVITSAATTVTDTGAILNGSANPNLSASTGWYRYSTTNPMTCNDTFGTRAPSSGGANLGAGSSIVDYTQPVVGLLPGTTYYFCAIASNALGTAFGSVLTFTTQSPPVVTTVAATSVTSTDATLNGTANPKLVSATGYFRYDTTNPGACNDTFGTRTPTTGGTALGAGNTAQPYSEALTGLTAGTTYYFCAIAENAVGKGFGAVLSFSTLAPPTVTTVAAMGVLSSAAVLNGTANPNQSATIGWFRYDTVNPGACDDTFGTRAPIFGGTSLGAGVASVPYSQSLSGLMPLTTYYYCAIASNPEGKSFGAVLSFSTSGAPAVTTNDATNVTVSGATLNASANPNSAAATGWFRYDTKDPGSCDDMFGTRVPDMDGTVLGSGAADVDFSEVIIDLNPGTTYYFCAIAENEGGTTFGEVLTFTTPPDAPTVTTSPATKVKATTAQLNGSANPNGDETTGWFRYATTQPSGNNCNDTFGTRAPNMGGTVLGNGVKPFAFFQAIAGIEPGVKYYFCAIAENAVGKKFGQVLSFVAGEAPPTVITVEAGGVGTGATIKGTADPNGSDTLAWFRLGETETTTCDDSFGKRVPETDGFDLGGGTVPAEFSQALTDLDANFTYYYCAAASNMAGAEFGEVLSFKTKAVPPVVRTVDAVVDQDTGEVTLNGSGNPKGAESTGWFRFSLEYQTACNDDFGTRVPEADGTALGDGREEVTFAEAVADLAAGSYYFCAIGENEAGKGFGDVLTFEVPEVEEPKPEPKPEPPSNEGGCGCRVVDDSTSGTTAIPLVGLFLLAFSARRRRRVSRAA